MADAAKDPATDMLHQQIGEALASGWREQFQRIAGFPPPETVKSPADAHKFLIHLHSLQTMQPPPNTTPQQNQAPALQYNPQTYRPGR